MTSAIFSPENIWEDLAPVHVLALRALAPERVFTPGNREEYLKRVTDDQTLQQIADAIFSDDFGFVRSLPKEFQDLENLLIQLVQIAYREGIRPADARVKAM